MRERLEEIYRQHRQGLFTLALGITGCPGRAEDAVHDAFERLCRSSPACADLVSYIYSAVRNAAVDQVRRAGTAAKTLAAPVSIFNGQDDPVAAAEAGEEQRLLRSAVEQLPQEQQQAVILKVYASLTFEQISQVLGEPLPTVAARYRRALESLRQRLSEVRQ